MKGRGVRSIDPNELHEATPDAPTKDKFILIDAVGVTETAKTASQPLERKRTVSFEKLLEQVASGARDDDTLSSLAGRLAALSGKLPSVDRVRIRERSGGRDLEDIARSLLDAIDPDVIEQIGGEIAAREAKEQAARVFDSAPLRKLLVELKAQSEVLVDEITPDIVTTTGFDHRQAEETTDKFKRFMDENKDELLALQVFYSRPYRTRDLTHKAVDDLAAALGRPPWNLTPPAIWGAYKRLHADRVRDAAPQRMIADIISLMRFALSDKEQPLETLASTVERNFVTYIARKEQLWGPFTDEQKGWLTLFKDYIAANAVIERDDLQNAPDFVDRGGLIAARRAFGARLDALLDELAEALVA
jgi:type I restriction enzyme R subunit